MPDKKALVRNAADPEQVRRAKDAVTFSHDDEVADLQAVLATMSGRRLLWRILGKSGFQRGSFSPDALTMAFQEGERNVALWLQAEIEGADSSAFLVMIREANRLDANTIEPESTSDE